MLARDWRGRASAAAETAGSRPPDPQNTVVRDGSSSPSASDALARGDADPEREQTPAGGADEEDDAGDSAEELPPSEESG